MIRIVLALCAVAACSKAEVKHLDLKAIIVSPDARLRTDTVGAPPHVDTATFVLVDAENTTGTGAFVTLGGELSDGTRPIGTLKPQSLWIPAHASRTFALVDREREPRPDASAAKIMVRGALIDDPPRVTISEVHRFDDYGKQVIQAYVSNDADRIARIMVIASFHDEHGKPMTRPFTMLALNPRAKKSVQLVGPRGSVRSDIYVGDVAY